ncbi:MAG: hypothetical protein WCT39_00025 [Candidatus Margulisiibacteriota bacterium]
MKIPYVEIEKDEYAPIVRLELSSALRSIETEAYVDSGASYSIFKVEIAEMLKINYLKGRKVLLTIGDGAHMPIYLHNLPVKFADHAFHARVGFSDKLGIEFNLLGRASFFDKFMICFNDKENFLNATWLGI